jgi:hypothetical protein
VVEWDKNIARLKLIRWIYLKKKLKLVKVLKGLVRNIGSHYLQGIDYIVVAQKFL